MAFQMDYTNDKGAHYPQSYWRIGWIQTDRSTKYARVRMDCYFNEAARNENVEGNVLENRFYDITEDNFTTVFEEEEVNIGQTIYAYVKDYADVPSMDGEEEVLVSFFADAVNV